jgi:hypothetical protein
MAGMTSRRADLAKVLDLFPEKSVAVRELFLRDEVFRGLCEDYALARDTLVRFQAMPDADHRPEVSDYRSLISELEKEIADMLFDAPKNPPKPVAANQIKLNPGRPE